MKKLLIGLFVIVFGVTLVACNESTTVTTTAGSTSTEEAVDMSSDEQVFTLQALSSASLLDYDLVNTLSYATLAEETTEADTEDLIDEEEVDEVDRYLEMVEQFLGNSNGLDIQVMTSDREAYQNLVSFTTVDISGNETTSYLYYNETLYEDDTDDTTTTEEPTTTEAPASTEEPTTTEAPASTEELVEGNEPFNFHDEDDDYVVYLLEGLLVQNEVEYTVEGKKVIEEDGKEIFRLRSFIDSENFVRVDFQTDPEDGKKKFFYQVVTDGVLITKSRVHVVEEDGALRVHMTFADEAQTARYQFGIIEEEGQTLIHVKYDIRPVDGPREAGNIHIVATVDSETGEVTYTYRILGPESKGQGDMVQHEFVKRHGKPDGTPGGSNGGQNPHQNG